MKAALYIQKFKIFAWEFFAIALMMPLLLGNLSLVYSQEEHAKQDHAGHHEHHMAVAAKRYISNLTSYVIPEVMLVESDGSEKLLSEAIDSSKAVMLNFIFTTCTAICPTMSATFAQVSNQMASDKETIQLISISVDPEHDTPEMLTKYAKKFMAGPEWRLFTGTSNNSILAQRAFDAYRGDKMNHLPLFFIHAPGSEKWVRIEGLVSADELITEYRMLAGK